VPWLRSPSGCNGTSASLRSTVDAKSAPHAKHTASRTKLA
jgi:hypothetical protein